MSGARLDAAIIGAGPAGCAAAIGLARAGWRVEIIEARAFPRIKPCGEFVSPGATRELEALLSPERLLSAGARRCDRLVIESGGRSAAWNMPAPAWVLSRRALDAMLLEEARATGAGVRQPAHVRTVEYHDDCVELALGDGARRAARVVIHADGSGRLDPRGAVAMASGVVGLKCHFRPPVPIEGLRMRAGRGGYVGTIEVERGMATCALVCRKEAVASGGGMDGAARLLWPEFDPAWRLTEWQACGVGRGRYMGSGHARSLRAGNAAGATDPVGGEGIGTALWSGRLLARLLADRSGAEALGEREPDGHVPDGRVLRGVHRRYAREYRARLRTRLPACRLAAAVLSRPRVVGAAIGLWRVPGLIDLTLGPWYALTGKAGS